MLGFPKTTEFNKRIPKQKFYENMEITPALKKVFVEQVKYVYWRNKLAASTINLPAGENVTEIEVFELQLNAPLADDMLLRQIDKVIPYHILFLLQYDGKFQAWIGYKEAISNGNNPFKVNSYYHTEWLPEEKIEIKLQGLNLDAVYENFVRQIAGEKLKPVMDSESLEESVARDKQRQRLQKQIAALQSKIRKEKQLNKQVQLNAELKLLKRELEVLQKV